MQSWAIGVDLGGTKIEVAMVTPEGQLLDRLRIPTPHNHQQAEVIKDIANSINDLLKKSDTAPSAIGIGVAGQIDKNTGIINFSPNLNWHNVDLRQQLADKLNIPVSICNDVKAAALGEWLYGAGKGVDDLVCIFVGTGIGGAIISNGKMIDGFNNTAGEIGHTTIQLNGPLCHCGNNGCLEAMASGWAIARDAQQAAQNDTVNGKLLLDIADGDIKAINAITVASAAQKGDRLALQLISNVVDALAAGVASVINMLGPRRVILGGGIIEGMPQLVQQIAERVKNRALKAALVSVNIISAKLHNDAGVIGAAAFATHQLKLVKYDN